MISTKSPLIVTLMASILILNACGDKARDEAPKTFPQFAFEFAARMAEVDVSEAGHIQERVIRLMIDQGELNDAERYMYRVRSWNRGSAFCYLAGHYFDTGDYEKGEDYVLKAEDFRKTVDDWPREHIASQIVAALAKGRDMERIAQIGERISSDENKWMSYASIIEAEALNRGVKSALELLDAEYEGEKSFGAIFAHPFALIGIYASSQITLTEEEKQELMERLIPALEAIPGSHFQSALDAMIARFWTMGDQGAMRRMADLRRTHLISNEGVEKTSCLKKIYQARYEAMAGHQDEASRLLDLAEPELRISSGLGSDRAAIMAEALAAA